MIGIGYNSLCYTVNPCCLSILCISIKTRNNLADTESKTYGYQRCEGVGEGQLRNMGEVDTHYFISLSKEFLNFCVHCSICCLPSLQNRRK